MHFVVLSLFFLLSWLPMAHAEVGKVLRIISGDGATLDRNGTTLPLQAETLLEEGDSIKTGNGSIMILLYPVTQMSLSQKTEIKLTQNQISEDENEKEITTSVIDFMMGLIRLQVSKDENQVIEQKINAGRVSFGVRGTEFEVSDEGDEVDLDVIEGEVEVTSPDVNTFVPEMVKANEGFQFSKKERKFKRRQFRQKFKNHPGFMQRSELIGKWREMRKLRRAKRLELKQRGLQQPGNKFKKVEERRERRQNQHLKRRN